MFTLRILEECNISLLRLQAEVGRICVFYIVSCMVPSCGRQCGDNKLQEEDAPDSQGSTNLFAYYFTVERDTYILFHDLTLISRKIRKQGDGFSTVLGL